ncbi:nucleoside phosphatase family-domain-containing protein [Butyriboletus roseoflavus]|nr:nucleoside phosphatase family-domain-containing protein [Butyriboletus roseoflavus]
MAGHGKPTFSIISAYVERLLERFNPQLSSAKIPRQRRSAFSTSINLGREPRGRSLPLSTPRFPMFATSNNNYERLEGGMSPVRPSRKFAWKKIAIGCGVLLGLIWFFGPRGDGLSADELEDDIYPPQNKIPFETPASVALDWEDDIPLTTTPTPTDSAPSSVPTSAETDPDPLGTVYCTESYAPHLPLVQYALMIDAGSTGSRIHIYKFNHCGPSPAYEYEVFKMIQPGLSDPTKTPQGAAESLDVLLDEALRVVPPSLHHCTPLAVKATAGLRLLGLEESQAILEAVETRLRGAYPFVVPDEDGVVIMDGKDEGVYAWITVNYLLGAIRADAPKDAPTYAVLDLGGGSTQIVFEPEKGEEARAALDVDAGGVLKDGEHKYELAFGGEERVLYQHSYLGYGLKSARESVHRVVEFMSGLRAARVSGELPRVPNPCLAQTTTKEVDIPLGEDKIKVLMAGEDVGSFEACNRVLELVMAKDAICEVKPCSFNGVYQPSLLDAFPTGRILLLSYFYDRIMPLVPPPPTDTQPRITVSTIATLARQVCAGPNSWLEHWAPYPSVIEELEGRPEWCLDLTFMHALLGLGYEFEDVRDVELGKRIEGTELGWCLGATIAMVGGGEVKCRA